MFLFRRVRTDYETVAIKEKVFWFDIAMEDAMAVEVFKTYEDGCCIEGCLRVS